MTTPEYGNELDNAIKQLEQRLAAQEEERKADRNGQGSSPLTSMASAMIGQVSKSGAGMAVLASVGQHILRAVKKDLRQNPKKLILKSIIGAVVVGTVAGYLSKKTKI